MLRRSEIDTTQVTYAPDAVHRFRVLPLQNEFNVLSKHWKLVLGCALLAIAIGGFVAWMTPDQYSSRVQLIVDNRTIHLGRPDAVFSDSLVTDAIIESQVEILRSETVALNVIDRLGLASDPEFAPEGPSLPERPSARQRVAAWIGLTPTAPETVDKRRAALSEFSQALAVRRRGMSHIIDVTFFSLEPAKSSNIANEIARVYLQRQTSDNIDAARTASAWLRARVQRTGPSTKVLTRASVPTYPSGLGDAVVVVGFAVLGIGFGLAATFAVDATDRGIRTPEAAAAALETNCFGSLPRVPVRRGGKDAASLFNYASLFPGSDFVHVLHHARLGAESFYPRETVRTVGVTSSERRAGKSIIAANFASVCAQATNGRVLLVDANPYMPSLSKSLAPNAAAGLMDVLEGRAVLKDVSHSLPERNIDFVPLAGKTRLDNQTGGLIWTGEMKRVIDDALASYERVIIDLPSIVPYADVRAAAQFVDIFLLAVAYETNANKLRRDLAALDSVRSMISGSILNSGARV
jgi:succinoglycan biosynthesis transport protein ExoP